MNEYYPPYDYPPVPYAYAYPYPAWGGGWWSGPSPAEMKRMSLESEARQIYLDTGTKPLSYTQFIQRTSEPYSALNVSTALGTLIGGAGGLLLQSMAGEHGLDMSRSGNWLVPALGAATGGILGMAASAQTRWSKNLSSYENYLDDIIAEHHAEGRLAALDPKRFEKRESHAASLGR